MSHICGSISAASTTTSTARPASFDYFENSRRATLYVPASVRHPRQSQRGFNRYGEFGWGLTASNGPGPSVLDLNGVQRTFFDYEARGAPYGPDDGTISPWAVATSLPFAPDIVLPTLRHAIERLMLSGHSPYGFDASFNPTHPPDPNTHFLGWVSTWIFGLNQGPIVLMIERILRIRR